MAHSNQVIEKIVAMKEAGIGSRAIAKALLKSDSKKSTVNDIYNRWLYEQTNKPTPRKYEAEDEDNSRILLISDLHIPYHHQDAFEFLQHLKDKYNPTRIIGLGDELDKHALSYHDSDPDLMSAGDELRKSQEYIKVLKKI